jgi:hypothetical protein
LLAAGLFQERAQLGMLLCGDPPCPAGRCRGASS